MMSCVFKEHFPRFVGAAFTFPLEPEARHRLAVAIKKEEKKRHGKDWRTCVRRKAGSTKASAIFLDSIDPPGCLNITSYSLVGSPCSKGGRDMPFQLLQLARILGRLVPSIIMSNIC